MYLKNILMFESTRHEECIHVYCTIPWTFCIKHPKVQQGIFKLYYVMFGQYSMFLLGFACVPALIRRSRARLIFKGYTWMLWSRHTSRSFLSPACTEWSYNIEIKGKRGKFVITCRTQSCLGLISRVCVESREHDRPICHTDSKGDYHIPNQRYCKSTTHDECVHVYCALGEVCIKHLKVQQSNSKDHGAAIHEDRAGTKITWNPVYRGLARLTSGQESLSTAGVIYNDSRRKTKILVVQFGEISPHSQACLYCLSPDVCIMYLSRDMFWYFPLVAMPCLFILNFLWWMWALIC